MVGDFQGDLFEMEWSCSLCNESYAIEVFGSLSPEEFEATFLYWICPSCEGTEEVDN